MSILKELVKTEGKNLILTAYDTNPDVLQQTIGSMSYYASKIGCDFLCINQENHSKNLPCHNFCKLYIEHYLNFYDKILWLDNDCLVNPEAPDIFQTVPHNQLSAWCDEGTYFKNDSRGRPLYGGCYFNTGVFVITKYQKSIILKAFELWVNRKRRYTPEEAKATFADQTAINRTLFECGGVPYHLDIKWNFFLSQNMCNSLNIDYNLNEKYILHFAGGAHVLTPEQRSDRELRLNQKFRANAIKEFKKGLNWNY